MTGKSWSDAVKDILTSPLGIDTIDGGINEDDIELMATGYTGGNSPAQRLHMSVPHAAGALVGDVQGLADWANAFHDGDVVSAESYAAMTSPTVLNNGDEEAYGYGLGFSTVKGASTIEHSGGIFGFTTDSLYIPSEDIFVGVLANSDAPATPPTLMTVKLAALAMDKPFPEFTAQTIDAAQFEPMTGIYESETVTRTFFIRDDTLYTLRAGGAENEVLSAGDNQFFYGPNDLSWFEIEMNADAEPRMIFHAPNAAEPDRLTRTGPVPEAVTVAAETLETYLGSYQLSIPMVAVIAAKGDDHADGITIQLTGQPPFVLQPNSDTEFAVPSVGALIQFAADDTGAMTLTILQGGQTITGERVE